MYSVRCFGINYYLFYMLYIILELKNDLKQTFSITLEFPLLV
jgi:hypothetical protein